MPDDKSASRKRWERRFDKIDFLISSLITAARSLALAAATILAPVLIGTCFGKDSKELSCDYALASIVP